ncbi:MAG TPA: aa3-type cytochrome c oxidase subunit IV [Allosphingosinicella sp.]|nr:aa3-type cytochrome c oxidase subunit IV [Allosphingosinicella sp.]
MAAESNAKELSVHRTGYDRFVTLMKWGAATSFIVALVVIFLIGS